MALSAPVTPKNNFATPKRLATSRTPALDKNGSTPKTQSSKKAYITPKSKKPDSSASTPECFSHVTVETPLNKNNRTSKEKDKCDEVSNLTVAVRIRPMNSKELSCVGVTNVVRVKGNELILRTHTMGSAGMSTDHIFQYDHLFWSCDETNPLYTTQEDVFMTVGKPLLNSAFRGYNACLFAYGQTGSGKSFSMMGRNMFEIVDIDSEEYSGITPRFCRDLFERISKLEADNVATVEVSYFEIYNEKIHDLLSSQSNPNRLPLKVREHPEWGPYVVDLSVHVVKSYKELRNWLVIGNKNRATAATSMNENSSRSHSIFSIELCLSGGFQEGDTSRRSRVSLVDLAGSERLGNNLNTEEKIREGVCINKSLLTLGKVISALADQKRSQFVPYRDSVLTWLLKESLGGNSLTCMLATISPASTHLDETLATLRYACQARSIVNRARVNESPHARLIRELRSEIDRLQALQQTYQRNSLTPLSSSSLILINDSNSEELDELRSKLTETESKLRDVQKSWEERFMESRKTQMKELAETEKLKAELESKMRVLKAADNTVNLSPYKSNFLEELEDVLTEKSSGLCESDILDNIKIWCSHNSLICTFTSDSLIIKDSINNRQVFLPLNKIDMKGFENIGDFINSLTWTCITKPVKKFIKSEVMLAMNQIYQTLETLQPPECENNLNLLYAKVNKSLQSFEAALLSTIKNTNGQKTVTFNM